MLFISCRKFSNISKSYIQKTAFGFIWFKLNDKISTDVKIDLNKKQLVINFKNKFPAYDMDDYDSINRYLNISSEGKKFYQDYKKFLEAVGSMPIEFIENGVTIEKWNEISAKRLLKNSLLTKHSQDSSRLAREYDRDSEKLDNELSIQMAKFTGLERLLGLGADKLIESEKIRLSKIIDTDERREATKVSISLRLVELTRHFLEKGCFPADFQ